MNSFFLYFWHLNYLMKTKVENKAERSQNNKKLRVFLLFLMLSFLFWMLIKLSKNYITDVKFDLVYVDEPKNKLLQNNSDNTITLTVNTIGFKLLRYSLKGKKLNYSLTDLEKKKGTEYYSITKSKINYLQAQFQAETIVLKVKPDTLYFDLGVKKSKKVQIIPKVNFQFKPGFNLTNKYSIKPEFVTISGPTKFVDSIQSVATELLELSDVAASFDVPVKLINDLDAISLSTDQVNISGEVEKITEGSFNLPFKVINLPRKQIISTFPKEVKVVYQVALKDYNKITENSFVIQCDYRETIDNNLEYLVPKIIEKPNILFDVKIVPNKIEYLIKQ